MNDCKEVNGPDEIRRCSPWLAKGESLELRIPPFLVKVAAESTERGEEDHDHNHKSGDETLFVRQATGDELEILQV